MVYWFWLKIIHIFVLNNAGIMLIGRKHEQEVLRNALHKDQSQFIAVYGRRRVGKTFLIRETFNYKFTFQHTGLADGKTSDQLANFQESLKEYGYSNAPLPSSWLDAFNLLKVLVKQSRAKKKVLFIDELPWLDTSKSGFLTALEHFWNGWATNRKDIVLIVCGSATSWIINHILFDRGGFYNRITGKIHLAPFNLKECEELFRNNGFAFSRKQVIDSYMVFGGIPYYLNLFDRRQSLAQNIDTLVINQQGQLHYEYEHLFASLFKNPGHHEKIIAAIARGRRGMTRKELAEKSGVPNGEGLTKTLSELEQCGFIRKYRDYTLNKQGFIYQLVDPFVLFSIYFLENETVDAWHAGILCMAGKCI